MSLTGSLTDPASIPDEMQAVPDEEQWIEFRISYESLVLFCLVCSAFCLHRAVYSESAFWWFWVLCGSIPLSLVWLTVSRMSMH